jgi:hypothetical protein
MNLFIKRYLLEEESLAQDHISDKATEHKIQAKNVSASWSQVIKTLQILMHLIMFIYH